MGFENLLRMRGAHKEMDEKEKLVHPVTDEEMELGEHDRTLGQIMQDKKEQERFSRFLYGRDPDKGKETFKALAEGTLLTTEQDTFLEKMRGEYNLHRAELEQVREMLTSEELGRIADVDPRIKEVIGKIGSEKGAELLGKEFEDLATSDSKAFKKMVTQMRLVHDLKTNEITGNLDRHVQEALQKYGVSEEQYWNATKSGASGGTQAELEKLVAEQFGWFKTTVNLVSGGKLARKGGNELYKDFKDQTDILKTYDTHLKAIGKILQGTLTPEVRLAIQKAALEGGEVHEKKVEDNVKTITDYKTAKEEIGQDLKTYYQTLQPRWEQYKNDEIKRLNIADISKQPQAIDGMKDRFAESEYQRQSQKAKSYRASGIFAALLAFLFSSQTKDKIKNSLQ